MPGGSGGRSARCGESFHIGSHLRRNKLGHGFDGSWASSLLAHESWTLAQVHGGAHDGGHLCSFSNVESLEKLRKVGRGERRETVGHNERQESALWDWIMKILHQVHRASLDKLLLQEEVELEIVDCLDAHGSRSCVSLPLASLGRHCAADGFLARVGADVNVFLANKTRSFAEGCSGGRQNCSVRDCSSKSIGRKGAFKRWKGGAQSGWNGHWWQQLLEKILGRVDTTLGRHHFDIRSQYLTTWGIQSLD